jgi:hypothetical protein
MNDVVRGMVAGAAGTTALNAITYVDMVWRGRPASDTPERGIERVEQAVPLEVPGDGETHDNRVAGLGPLTGIAAGIGTGMLLGVLRAVGWRPGRWTTALLATATAMVLANGPLALLGVTDPRRWTAADWASDVVPHAVYGVVASMVLTNGA